MLEELARALIDSLNGIACASYDPNNPPDALPVDVEKATEALDQFLLDQAKTRATKPEFIAHAKKVALAFNDFDVDESPLMATDENDSNVVWVGCWMRLIKDPETGDIS